MLVLVVMEERVLCGQFEESWRLVLVVLMEARVLLGIGETFWVELELDEMPPRAGVTGAPTMAMVGRHQYFVAQWLVEPLWVLLQRRLELHPSLYSYWFLLE